MQPMTVDEAALMENVELVRVASPRARITGLVYLLYFVTAILASLLIRKKLTVAGESLSLLADGLYVAVTVLLYRLFRPVNQKLSLVASVFSLAGCAVMVLAQLHLVSRHFSPLFFFGPFCILLGYLVLRSVFLPRFLGLLLMLAGLAWIVYLLPGLPPLILGPIQALGILAEGVLMLWLLVLGTKPVKQEHQAL